MFTFICWTTQSLSCWSINVYIDETRQCKRLEGRIFKPRSHVKKFRDFVIEILVSFLFCYLIKNYDHKRQEWFNNRKNIFKIWNHNMIDRKDGYTISFLIANKTWFAKTIKAIYLNSVFIYISLIFKDIMKKLCFLHSSIEWKMSCNVLIKRWLYNLSYNFIWFLK